MFLRGPSMNPSTQITHKPAGNQNPSKAEERETGKGKTRTIQTQDLATTISKG